MGGFQSGVGPMYAGLLLRRQITLQPSDIKALSTKPVVLVPTPGGSDMVVGVAVAYRYIKKTTNYSGNDAGHLVVTYDGVSNPATIEWDVQGIGPLLGSTAGVTGSVGFYAFGGAVADDVANIMGRALVIQQDAGPALTAGDGTLTVWIWYYIQDISVGGA